MSLPIKAVIEVAEKPDCTIRVFANDNTQKPPAEYAVDFSVHRQIVAAASDYLKIMITSRNFADTGKAVVEFTEITPTTMLLILCKLHHRDHMQKLVSLEKPQLEHMWELAAKIDEFGLSIKTFKPEFRQWRKRNGELLETQPQDLLYPTWDLDDAFAFQQITKSLAYNHAGHIKEGNPTKFHQYHLPERVIGGLNAARGRLKTILQKYLHDHMLKVFRTRACTKRARALFVYLEQLVKAGCWPIDDALSETFEEYKEPISINELLEKLRMLPPMPSNPGHACSLCPSDWKDIVDKAIEVTEGYFQCLCIDCMETSRTKQGSKSSSYWDEWRESDKFDRDCRIAHGEPTWYHSWLGRPEDRQSNLRRRHEYKKQVAGRYRGD